MKKEKNLLFVISYSKQMSRVEIIKKRLIKDENNRDLG